MKQLVLIKRSEAFFISHFQSLYVPEFFPFVRKRHIMCLNPILPSAILLENCNNFFYAKRCRPVVRTGARRTARSSIRISKRMIGKNSKKQTDAIAASAIRRTQHYSEKNTTAKNYVIRPSAGPRYRGTSASPADIEYHKKK